MEMWGCLKLQRSHSFGDQSTNRTISRRVGALTLQQGQARNDEQHESKLFCLHALRLKRSLAEWKRTGDAGGTLSTI